MNAVPKKDAAAEEEKSDRANGWLRFSHNRPNASAHLHQAAALLHSLEESLRCFICRDIFTIPVSIQPCHHSFCNDCIRSKLQDDTHAVMRCPICQTKLDDTIDLSQCLVLNRSHEETARHYKTLRPVLRAAMVSSLKPAPTSLAAAAGSPRKARGAYGKSKKRSSTVMNEDGTPKEVKSWKKKGNPWIREQFREEWVEEKQTWSFVCLHCGLVGFRSKEKKLNATKLTEHITLKCSMATPEIKQEAISHTQGAKRIRRMDEEMAEQARVAANEEDQAYFD
mmetsp:Transcript_27703/g.57997  ORF Transcript_27703/g.57997 Transcript_27703/m.57997 type:complete len:281 (-) Transcript_27703:208-1050(-)|eukprot:CAMPEP_0172443184 /NCGR_PEP_ID=MMETSP1065-20121228/3494_1 /TAXON_ID=265537 /ORGANISM="Amphiprora paludosa, Strain CCMP125" /LENGTH=280 /DNA_ID=CAMNT_0013193327 /DNA_START=236 /DNA_END=1078 /DNA_ORIENTATION=-